MNRRRRSLAVAAALLGIAGCSGGAGPAGAGGPRGDGSHHGSAVSVIPSGAPTAPPGVALPALQRLHWAALPADPLGPRQQAITAWSGSEFLAVGGSPVSGNGAGLTGADAYDPKTRAWHLLPDFPLAARDTSASAWTGYGLLVWGGETNPGGSRSLPHALSDGAILDVTKQRWHVMPAGPLPALSWPVAVTDAADQVIIMGGQPEKPSIGSGGRPVLSRLVASYDPANGAWRRLPPLPSVRDHDLVDLKAVQWGSYILVAQTWQHIVPTAPGSIEGTGGVDLFLLDPKRGEWSAFRPVTVAGLFGADFRPLGSSLVIAGGTSCLPFASCPYQPRSAFAVVDARGRPITGIPTAPIELRAETDVGTGYVAMTGSQVTGAGHDEQPGDTAAFDLATKRWITLPNARRFKPEPESLTWTGHELIAVSPTGLIALGPDSH